MADLSDLLKKLLESVHIVEVSHGPDCECEPDYSKWIQVARLGQEDLIKHKAHAADLTRFGQDIEVLIAQVESLKAQALAKKRQWWTYLRQKYGIPARGNLHLTDDHRILMEPEK